MSDRIKRQKIDDDFDEPAGQEEEFESDGEPRRKISASSAGGSISCHQVRIHSQLQHLLMSCPFSANREDMLTFLFTAVEAMKNVVAATRHVVRSTVVTV